MLRHLYGYFYLRLKGNPLEEDALNLAMRIGLAVSLTAAGKHEEALTEARRILELDPTFVPAYSLLAMDVTKAPLQEALDYAEKGCALSPWYPINAGLLAGMLVRSGDPVRALEPIQEPGEGLASGATAAFILFHLPGGEIEKAAEWMEKAIEQRRMLRRTQLTQALCHFQQVTAPARRMGKPPRFAEFIKDGLVRRLSVQVSRKMMLDSRHGQGGGDRNCH